MKPAISEELLEHFRTLPTGEVRELMNVLRKLTDSRLKVEGLDLTLKPESSVPEYMLNEDGTLKKLSEILKEYSPEPEQQVYVQQILSTIRALQSSSRFRDPDDPILVHRMKGIEYNYRMLASYLKKRV